MNPMQLMNMIRSGGNPEQFVMNLLQTQMGDTPMGKNLMELAKQGNTQEIEKIVRNFASSRGVDFDKEFTNFKQTLGL